MYIASRCAVHWQTTQLSSLLRLINAATRVVAKMASLTVNHNQALLTQKLLFSFQSISLLVNTMQKKHLEPLFSHAIRWKKSIPRWWISFHVGILFQFHFAANKCAIFMFSILFIVCYTVPLWPCGFRINGSQLYFQIPSVVPTRFQMTQYSKLSYNPFQFFAQFEHFQGSQQIIPIHFHGEKSSFIQTRKVCGSDNSTWTNSRWHMLHCTTAAKNRQWNPTNGKTQVFPIKTNIIGNWVKATLSDL